MALKTKDMILIALFAALTAVGAFIKIPTPIVLLHCSTCFVPIRAYCLVQEGAFTSIVV